MVGVGGTKIFRDDIFGGLKFPFRNDHIIYKRDGHYDFPHKFRKSRIINTILLILGNIKGFRDQVFGPTNIMLNNMYSPIDKIVK